MTHNINLQINGSSAIKNAINNISSLSIKLKSLNKQKINLGQKFALAVRKSNKLNKNIQALIKNQKKLNLLKSEQGSTQKSVTKVEMPKTLLAFSAPMKLAINFESSMKDIKNNLNIKNNKESKAFDKEFLKLSKNTPIKMENLISITKVASKLDLAKQNVLDFTKTTSMMSVAFGILPNKLALTNTKLMETFDLNPKKLKQFANEIVSLSTKSTSSKDILMVIEGISEKSKAFGLSARQTSSLASTFLKLGKSPKEAINSIDMLVSRFSNASNQSQGFQNSLKHLNLNAKDLQESIKLNPQKAILDFFEQIKSLDSSKQVDILSNMFEGDTINDILLASKNVDIYKNAISTLNTNQTKANLLQKKFDESTLSTEQKIEKLTNSVLSAGINFGTLFLPILNVVITKLAEFTNSISSFISNYPTLVKVISSIAFGLSLTIYSFKKLSEGITKVVETYEDLKVAGSKLKKVFLKMKLDKKIITMYQNLKRVVFGLKKVFLKMNIATKAQVFWNKLLFASSKIAAMGTKKLSLAMNLFTKSIKKAKIGLRGFLAASGIGLLLVAAGLIFEYWKPIKTFFVNLWDGIKKKAMPFFNWFSNKLNPIKDFFKSVGSFFSFSFSSKKEENLENKKVTIPKVKKAQLSNVSNNSTFNVNITNPSSNVDIEKTLLAVEKKRQNRTYEDLE